MQFHITHMKPKLLNLLSYVLILLSLLLIVVLAVWLTDTHTHTL